MKFVNQTIIILMKEILSEYKTKDVLISMLLFGLLVILMFNFAFEPDSEEIKSFGPGLLWMTFIFAGLLGMNRTFAGEKENKVLEGLMLSPISWNTIYLGKMLANLLFMLLAESIILCLFSLFFNYAIWPRIEWMAIITFLGTLGFSAVGTLLAAVSMNTRMSEVMLPILLLPLALPVILSVVLATTANFSIPTDHNAMIFWIKVLLAYDIIFITVPLMTFDFVLEE